MLIIIGVNMMQYKYIYRTASSMDDRQVATDHKALEASIPALVDRVFNCTKHLRQWQIIRKSLDRVQNHGI